MRQKLLKPDGTEIVDLEEAVRSPISPFADKKLLMRTFDSSNVADIMARCLVEIYPICQGDDIEKRLTQRVNDYIAVENFEIAVNLLWQLTLAEVDRKRTDKQEERIFELTLKIIRATEEKYAHRESFEKALDILVGIIRRHPSLYSLRDDSVRVLLKRLFLSYQEGVEYDILTNIAILAGSMNDKYLLSFFRDFYQKEKEALRGVPTGVFYLTHNNERYLLLGMLFHIIANFEEDMGQ